MTYLLGSMCKDGVALIADTKIVYQNHQIGYQEKLILIDDSIVIGASGEVSLFDAFRERIRPIVREYRSIKDINWLLKKIEDTTQKVNSEYEYKVHSRNFDLLVAIHIPELGTSLKYVYPYGYHENVSSFRVLGLGEPYGLIFLRKLWRRDISMVEAAELGYRVIRYIEEFDLNGSVGIGEDKPQIFFMSNDGRLRKASESLLRRLDESSSDWLRRQEHYIKESYRPSLTADGYVCIRKWGTHCTTESGIVYTEGIDMNSLGEIYLASQYTHCVEKYSRNGDFISLLKTAGSEETRFNIPFALAVDFIDNIYVSESGSCRIQKFNRDGTFSLAWGSRGTGDSQFSSPHGLCVDSSRNVYVSEGSNHRIQKFDSNGTFILKWGSKGTGCGEFNSPLGIATDFKNNVYVVD